MKHLVAGIGDVRIGTRVLRVTREDNAAFVETAAGEDVFDGVVLACHSDQALQLLDDADSVERGTLGDVRYQDNEAWLHTDVSLLPRAKEAWSAWNYLAGGAQAAGRPVSVSYLLNRLQPLPCSTPVMVTLNPLREPAPGTVLRRITYAHPVFDGPAIAAQRRLPGLQGRRRTWFCGAWTRYGFHEDGLLSAIHVANALGVQAPWQSRAVAA